MIDRYLSIWEIAHRWRDVNPDKTDPADIPLNVQDTIRYICRAVLASDLDLFHQVVMTSNENNNGSGFRSEIRQFHVNEMPAELEDCLYRKYDKNALNVYFIEGENLFHYCVNDQCTDTNAFVDFPTCWSHLIDGSHPSEQEQDNIEKPTTIAVQPLRPSQIDKLICQAIAKTLWDVYPSMTISAMSEHTAILEHGGGKLYKGKNTLRDWLSEVAPEDVKKPGRPKISKPTNDAA